MIIPKTNSSTCQPPAFLIEVELLKEKADVVPNGHLPLHEGKGVELLKNEPECRVYRFTLQDVATDVLTTTEIALNLPTEAVLLVLDDCEVEITNVANDKQVDSSRWMSVKMGDDVHLNTGKFGLKLLSHEKTQFVLAEVY